MNIPLVHGDWTAAQLVVWFLCSYLWHGLGITLGYHRLLTHKALKVPRWLMYVIVAGGYLCLMGSPIVWVAVHRLHHLKSDQPGDPHSPREGFMHALVGWMFTMDQVQSDEEVKQITADLMQDPILRLLGAEHKAWQAQMCLGINIAFRGVLWLLFGWQVALLNFASMFIVFWSTQLVNTVCHMPKQGYQTFNTREDSTNVWWVAILSLGEGWHNNHHAVPKSARHGLAWWEVDVTWISIWLLNKLGLGSAVVLPNAQVIAAKSIAGNTPAPEPAASQAFPQAVLAEQPVTVD